LDKTVNSKLWLKLDNAAKIYPAVHGIDMSAVFRITAELKETIKAKELIEAVREIEDLFPFFKVGLKKGFFWNYLEHQDYPIELESDNGLICRYFPKDKNLFRILAQGRSISVEFSHIITDATGGVIFLKTLLLKYFEICKIFKAEIKTSETEKDDLREKMEDAYNKYFRKLKVKRIKVPKAFHVPFRLKAKPRFEALILNIPVDKVYAKSKDYGVSITVYLISLYVMSLQNIFHNLPTAAKRRAKKTIRIEVPMNLRRMFPTKTMRNFSLYVLPEIDLRLGYYKFEEILKIVYHQMQLETDKKLINKMISRNVSGEKKALVRGMPLLLKSIFLSRLYINATKHYSGVVTNYGKIDFPEVISNCIDRFIFTPPPPNKVLRINCGVIGYQNNLTLSFGNITVSKDLEGQFVRLLMKDGISVKIIKKING